MTQVDPVEKRRVEMMWKNMNLNVLRPPRGVTPEVSHRLSNGNELQPKEIGRFPPFHRPYDYDCYTLIG